MKINLSIIKSIFVIAVTIGITSFALTQSFFRDTEQSAESSFLVGTLDLAIDGNNGIAADNIVVQNLGSKEVLSGSKTWEINNVGTLPGLLSMDIANRKSFENGCNEPEQKEDSSCENPGEGQGELGEAIQLEVKLKNGASPQKTVANITLGPNVVQELQSQWLANAGQVVVEGGGTALITVSWRADDSQYRNDLQSDSLTFDVVFGLAQQL